MIEYIKVLPLITSLLSIRFNFLLPLSCVLMISYLGFTSYNLNKEFGLFFIKEEILFSIIALIILFANFKRKTRMFFRSKIHISIAFFIFIDQSLFSSLFMVELFRISMFSSIKERTVENQTISLFIKSYLLICIFLNLNTSNYLLKTVSLNDININKSLVFLTLCYLIDFVLEFFKDIKNITNKWSKFISFIVFILALVNYINNFGLFSKYLFTYISSYSFELSVFLVLMFFNNKNLNLYWPALILIIYFSSIVFITNTFYLYLLLIPPLLFYNSRSFENKSIRNYVEHEQAILPFTFTFLVSLGGITIGGGFLKIILSVILLYLVISKNLLKVERYD